MTRATSSPSAASGIRKAPLANRVTILRAHGCSSAALCGRQTKIFWRLAVVPGPFGWNGPFTTMLKIAPLRGNVAYRSFTPAAVEGSRSAAVIVRWPAST